MSNRVVVFLQTMGNRAGDSIVSLGAVGDDRDELSLNISLKSCLEFGLKTDPTTLLWWLKQPPESRACITDPHAAEIDHALGRFSHWLKDHEFDGELWTLRSSWAMPILEAAFKACDRPIPWTHRAPRCLRTLSGFLKSVEAPDSWTPDCTNISIQDARANYAWLNQRTTYQLMLNTSSSR